MSDEKYGFVIMIQSRWWEGFRRRHSDGKETHSYVRAGRAPPKEASLIFFYVVKPVCKIEGYAYFIERKTGDANAVWKEFGEESVLTSKKQYDDFLESIKEVSFIRFRSLHDASKPVPLNDLLLLLDAKRLGRRGFYVDKETAEKIVSRMR